MTLATVQTEVRVAIGGRSDLDSIIIDKVNETLHDVTTKLKIDQMLVAATAPTVDKKFEYLLPLDCYSPLYVIDETDDILLDEDETFSFDSVDPSSTGPPRSWARYNNLLILFNRVPDATIHTIKMRYWKRHPTLVNPTDNHLLPAEWEEIIKVVTTSKMFGVLDQPEKAAAKIGEFQNLVASRQLPESVKESTALSSGFNFGPPKV